MDFVEKLRDYQEWMMGNQSDLEAANRRLIAGDETTLADLPIEPHAIQEFKRRLMALIRKPRAE
jgi:hypothetical protein